MAPRERFPRSSCAVPFCRRTSTVHRLEWLCADHWRLVPRWLKAYRTKRLKTLYRAWEKANAAMDRERELSSRLRWHRAERLIWRRMERIAIERAAAI